MKSKFSITFFLIEISLIVILTCSEAIYAAARKLSPKEATEIIKKLTDWYRETENYSMDVEISSYKTFNDPLPHETASGFTKKSGNNFHSMMMGIETIQNDRYQIVIDTAKKIISIKDASQNIWENINVTLLEKYMTTASAITISENAADNLLKIEPSAESSLKFYEMVFDKKFRIRKIVMQILKNELSEDGRSTFQIDPKIEFRFDNYLEKRTEDPAQFSTSSYFISQGDSIIPKSKYSSFKFLDLRVFDNMKK